MRKFSYLLILSAALSISFVSAHIEGGDCVIEDFKSDIMLNKDSSVDITEDLLVDCGDLPGKHGIFRILPTKSPIRPDNQYRRAPVTLISITDFSGQSHPYETLSALDTVTWKIGDPDVTIQGLNEYRIKYTVENAVYLEGDKDVFYWNLNGNFWELETESYQATIHLPAGLDQDVMQVQLFSGDFGDTANSFSTYAWLDKQTLQVTATVPLSVRQGITLKSSFPQNIVTRYEPSWLQLYGGWLWYLPALGLLLMAYRLWSKFGRDPKLNQGETVQYEPPLKLRPMETGLLDSFGMMRNEYLSATIVDLAVRGHLKIKEIPKQGLLSKKDWELTRVKHNEKDLKPFEVKLMDSLFGSSDTTTISEHKNEFYKDIPDIKTAANKELEMEGIFDSQASKTGWIRLGLTAAVEIAGYLIIGLILYIGARDLLIIPHAIIALVLSTVGLVLAAILMPRRTQKGAEAKHHLDGFRMYLTRAEKYRMQFYEKEHIFEKYLPYAVAFGVTDKWIKAFKELVGYEKASHYVPAWYVATSGQAFAIDSFTTQMNSLASDISSSLSSSPGGSGGGGSGGGGGGGGGGSW